MGRVRWKLFEEEFGWFEDPFLVFAAASMLTAGDTPLIWREDTRGTFNLEADTNGRWSEVLDTLGDVRIVLNRVERFGCRATVSIENIFRSEFGQNYVRIQEI